MRLPLLFIPLLASSCFLSVPDQPPSGGSGGRLPGPAVTYESSGTANPAGELDQVLGNIDGQNKREANFAANTAAALESPPMRGGNFSSFEQATTCTSLLAEAEEAVGPCAQELFVDLCGDGKGHYHGSECPRCEDLLAKDSKLSEAGCPARIRYPPYRL